MSTYARIQNGVLAEIIVSINVNAQFASAFVATLIDIDGVSPAPQEGWTYLDGVFSAPVVPTPTQTQLAADVVFSVVAASAAVVGQIFTDPAHQSAFQNAASIVNGNGGAAPSTGSVAMKFAALATVYGLTATAFATLVIALQGASLDLSSALSIVELSAASATTGAQLATALSAFETAIGNVVTEVNAASPPIPIVAPAAISIKGVNA